MNPGALCHAVYVLQIALRSAWGDRPPLEGQGLEVSPLPGLLWITSKLVTHRNLPPLCLQNFLL